MFARWGIALVALTFCGASAIGAEMVTFDFEELPATSTRNSHPAAHTTVSSTKDGLTLTLRRESGATFDIIDLSGEPFPTGWGSRGLDPFCDTGGHDFVADFSSPILAASVQIGDFGGDADSLSLKAYTGPGGGGTEVDSHVVSWAPGDSLPDYAVLEVAAGPGQTISSILFEGGTAGYDEHDCYSDNVTVTVPEPTVLALVTLGGFGLIRRRRR